MGTSQVVLTKEIPLWEDPTGTKREDLVGTKKEILEVLSKVIDDGQCSWLDLVLRTNGQGSTGPFVNKIFIVGRREDILYNLQKIVKRIAAGKEWRKDGVRIGFDIFKKPRIEDLI